ncbi:hypothetical protein B0H34DRAFT_94522 [Crassisporium funariophilum]|nr:hypothetical protein B0H34DRAFT_94522 [Crassisporium funariophilum]
MHEMKWAITVHVLATCYLLPERSTLHTTKNIASYSYPSILMLEPRLNFVARSTFKTSRKSRTSHRTGLPSNETGKCHATFKARSRRRLLRVFNRNPFNVLASLQYRF